MAVNFNKTSVNNIVETDAKQFVTADQKTLIDNAIQIGNNLSDVADVSAVRSNLGLGSAALANIGTGENQLPTLNSNGKLPGSVMPALSISSIQVVDDIDARDKLTNVQEGDIVKVKDDGNGDVVTYIYNGSDYVEIQSKGQADVTTVAGRIGDVTLTLSDLTDVESTVTEVNYLQGVTSSVQAQINARVSAVILSDEIDISDSALTLPEVAKGITSVYIVDNGYLASGYSFTSGDTKVSFDDDSLNGDKAIVTYVK